MASKHKKRKGVNSHVVNNGQKVDDKCKRVYFYNKKLRVHVKKSISKYLYED